ncbi:gliding motility-associated C-terminal domain-containing protein [Pedobacter sp. SL55]|uniref:T9SS type B sorting domain-containing protein n=1 Tax=Pedobacter sp. SL55 TaxID=2995161 RepID=UPI00226EAF96|nr:gliding motility-associated C-terminal domain-containing protein [Pedobacter sp. SL55]WAC42262.1 gliding motility-associated C-terminal domain-containing protein [Pedobacter sp. SL55]
MKLINPLSFLIITHLLTFFYQGVTPQHAFYQQNSCSVSLSGGSCVGEVLTVNSSEPVQSIMWMLNGVSILEQNIARQNNGVVVAGGNGAGVAQNQFQNPAAIFIDKDGNLFVPDMTNNRIQKWAPGAVTGTTVAGGNGIGNGAHQFNRPTGVAVDKDGNIYVADQNNRRVQKWAPGATSGVTLASGIGSPTRLCFDGNGNLYVSAQSDDRILMFANATGAARVVAGGNGNGRGANQLASPTGIFVDDRNNLYICDTDNTRIQKWVLGESSGRTVATLSTNPLGILVDKTDNMYICDYTGYAVLKWPLGASSGTIIAGGNGPGSNPNQIKPVGIFMDEHNSLFVSDFDNARVIKFSNIYTGSYTTLQSGVYTAKITTANGCTSISNPITIVDKIVPQINITADRAITCTNFPLLFTANIRNGGSAPKLQWRVNGADIPNANAATFSSASIKGGDVVSCTLTNLDQCVSNAVVLSNTLVPQDPLEEPNVQISLDQDDVCKGSLQTFQAMAQNAGTNPTYQWLLNGLPIIGAQNSRVFKSNVLNHNDVVACVVTSSAMYCQANSTAVSNELTVKIKPILTPTIAISTNEKKIYEGLTVSFNAVTQHDGDDASYVWKINGNIVYIGGKNFTTNTLKAGDKISCEMTVNTPCVSSNKVLSNLLPVNVIKIEKVIPPNAFTPNGDGINDVWNIDELRVFPNCTVKVFAKNGSEVFTSKGYKKPWDGFYKGKVCPVGVYYYLIVLDGRQKLSGSLTIIK